MKTSLIIFMFLALSVLGGCQGAAKKEEPLRKGKELLSVDFQEGKSLRYKFISRRSIEIITRDSTRRGKESSNKNYETMEMVATYTPVKIDPYGPTVVKAVYETVRVKRSGQRAERQDAVETLSGKSFTFTVSPAGKIEDYSQLRNLIRQTGDRAFRPKSKWGKIKNPDMISDFIATQWFLWDSISSIKNPVEGVSIGQSWNSQLSVPTPMIIQKARDVTYRLAKINESEKGRLAVITSSFLPSELTPKSWPIPYPDGSFQMSGKFGFYRNYRVLDLTGHGEQVYNIDAGRIEKDYQEYQMVLSATPPFGISLDLKIIITQKLITQLLED